MPNHDLDALVAYYMAEVQRNAVPEINRLIAEAESKANE